MWQRKRFTSRSAKPTAAAIYKTFEAMEAWLSKREGKIQYTVLYVENGYVVEWRRLRKVL